jgi:SpoIID/LytB domain protein
MVYLGSGGLASRHSPRPGRRADRRAGAQAGVLVIDGAGDGHGVGMSQTGAEGLALHGYSAQQILTHYYTGTTRRTLAPAG